MKYLNISVMEMTLYKGSVYKQFVIDRLAMGYSHQAICEMFEALYGDKITVEFISEVSAGCEDEIKAREKELLEELSKNSVSIEGRLESLYGEVKEVLEELKENKQWKQYASVLQGLLKNIELLAKSLGRLHTDNTHETKILVQKNNYRAIMLMADDGVLSVKDRQKLKRLLGIEEDDENAEEGVTYVEA
jgi:hypothetical protein